MGHAFSAPHSLLRPPAMVNNKTTYEASRSPAEQPGSPSSEIAQARAGADPSANESEVPKDYKRMFDERAAHTKFVDPCEDARKESMRCLDKNNYNRDACTDFFKSYRECKKKWLNQRRDDRRAGLDV